MNTQHFRYAVEVERTGSISQAAENLYIGQPTLSKVIKDLEDTLGITIFSRTPRGTVATEKGAQFLKYAKAVLSQVEMMESLGRPEDPDRQCLSVCVPHADYILRATSAFAASLNPALGMLLRVEETGALAAVRSVREESVRLGVIRYSTAHESYFSDYLEACGLESETIWEFEPLLVMAEGSPLAQLDRISEEMLGEYVEIESGDGQVPYLSGGEGERDPRRSSEVAVSAQAERLELLGGMPAAYLWSSPVPIERLMRYGLVQRRCPASGRRNRDALIFRRGTELSRLEKKYVDRLYAAKNEVAFQLTP